MPGPVRALLAVVVLGALATPTAAVSERADTAAAARPPAASSTLAGLDAQLEALATLVSPSVVQVIASGYTTGSGALLSRARALGSGVIVDPAGWIVTNAHVVEGARAVHVDLLRPRPPGALGSILPPGSRRLAARVVGTDRETDIAVLHVDRSDLPALPLGDSDGLPPGPGCASATSWSPSMESRWRTLASSTSTSTRGSRETRWLSTSCGPG